MSTFDSLRTIEVNKYLNYSTVKHYGNYIRKK